MAHRQRDVLPIRQLDGYSFDRSSVSHSIRKRLCLKNQKVSWANEGISVINRIGADFPVASLHSEPGAASLLAAQNIWSAYKQMPPPQCSSPEGALTELLTSSGYYSSIRTDVRPYSKESISWPAQGSRAVELENHLGVADRQILIDWESTMLRGQDDYHSYISQQKSFKPYFDPELADNHSTYGDFLTRLHAAGMLRFRASHETCGALGIFFVRKKDDSLRLIFDTRKLNMRFKDPPKTELPTASAMSNIESFDSSNVYLGSGDIKNAFYSSKVPDALSDLFTLPRIRAKYLPASLRVSFDHEDTWVTPCLTVLPMGWNWALHLCQSFTSNVVKIACPDASYFSDSSGSRHLSSPADTLTTCYVDNFCVLGHDPKLVDLQLSKNINTFQIWDVLFTNSVLLLSLLSSSD